MSLPRSLSLRRVSPPNSPAHYVLVQRPVAELEQLRANRLTLDTSDAAWPPKAVTKPGELKDNCFELEATLDLRGARSCGFRIRTGPEEFTEIGYDQNPGVVYLDRRQSGDVEFHPAFAGRHEAPARLTQGKVQLRVFVDRSLVEVFINSSLRSAGDQPSGQSSICTVGLHFQGRHQQLCCAVLLRVCGETRLRYLQFAQPDRLPYTRPTGKIVNPQRHMWIFLSPIDLEHAKVVVQDSQPL